MARVRTRTPPLYENVQDDLARRIKAGELKPGDSMMSESDLCALYDVSRITVRRALDNLAMAGLIVKRRGVGSFVAGRRAVRFRSSLDDMLAQNGDGRKFLTDEWSKAPPAIAERLGQAPDTLFRRIDVLLYENGEPFALTRYYLIPEFGEGITQEAVLEAGSLIRAVERRAGQRVARAHQLVEPALVPADVAPHLGLLPGTPILRVDRTYYLGDGRPVEAAIVHGHPQRYRYTMELVARPG